MDESGAVDLSAAMEEAETKGLIEEAATEVNDEQFGAASGMAMNGQEILCPATVALVNGSQVRGEKTNSMIFSQMGIFIIGMTGTGNKKREVSRVIPWDRVDYIDYDFALLDKLMKEQQSPDE